MNDERWRQVDRIFHEALEQEPQERKQFLDRVCANDPALRREVEELILSFDAAGTFLESSASGKAGGSVRLKGAAALTGRVFGRYELQSLLGSGGMGDVYRARDSELKRDIAIKVLPDAFSRDAERVARFRREAEVLASLNHPNIAAIHDIETLGESHCLVLELVEGETLAERLARGPIEVDAALRLAKQIAEALEAAHEKGVVHRDLKPANIKITPDGTVKVLDFGLAKVREAEGAGGGGPNLEATMATTPGMIMGTAPYMAPEQARGKAVDKRTDIWAFGCVLYEMLTGRVAFKHDTVTDTLAAVLERDPEWSALPAATPATIQRLLVRCLDKNLRGRLHDIADARIEIEDALSGAELTPADTAAGDRRAPAGLRWPMVWAASLIALIAIGALTWRVLTTPQAAPAALSSRTTIATSGEAAFRLAGLRSMAITPDGASVVYIGGDSGSIFVRPIHSFEPPRRLVNGAAPLNFVFVSPDGQWVGYVEGKQLKKVAFNGGASVPIYKSSHSPLGAAWAPDDTLIIADEEPETGLKLLSVDGRELSVLTRPEAAHNELDHAWPEMLPGGKAVLFTVTATSGGIDAAQVFALDLANPTAKPKRLVGGSHAHYLPSGHLVYTAGGALQAIPFDPVRLEIVEPPVTILPRVVTKLTGGGDFDVAGNGTLVYADAAPGTTVRERSAANRTLVWVTRSTGDEEPLGAPDRPYVQLSLSPDKTRVAVALAQPSHIGIWDRGVFRRLTSPAPPAETTPIWLNSRDLAFFSPGAERGSTLWKQSADGIGEAEVLSGGTVEERIGPPSGVTPDGKMLIFSPGGADIMLLPLDSPGQAQPLLATPSIERNGVISPDGRWLAYESDTSGSGPFEIYVAPFSNPGKGQSRISVAGGTRPLWSPVTPLELFWVATGGAIMAARIDAGGMRVGDAMKVVEGGRYLTEPYGFNTARTFYDVSNDGRRFLMIKNAPSEPATPPQINIFQNWLEELKRLAPGKR